MKKSKAWRKYEATSKGSPSVTYIIYLNSAVLKSAVNPDQIKRIFKDALVSLVAKIPINRIFINPQHLQSSLLCQVLRLYLLDSQL